MSEGVVYVSIYFAGGGWTLAGRVGSFAIEFGLLLRHQRFQVNQLKNIYILYGV